MIPHPTPPAHALHPVRCAHVRPRRASCLGKVALWPAAVPPGPAAYKYWLTPPPMNGFIEKNYKATAVEKMHKYIGGEMVPPINKDWKEGSLSCFEAPGEDCWPVLTCALERRTLGRSSLTRKGLARALALQTGMVRPPWIIGSA